MNKFILSIPILLLSTVACDTLHENFSGACWMTEDSVTATQTMRCPDGSRATWDAPYGDGNCMISENAEGMKTIHCPDGSSAVLPVYVDESIGDEDAVCTVLDGPAEEKVLQCGGERAVLSAGCRGGYPGNVLVPTDAPLTGGEDQQSLGTAGNEILYYELGCDRILGTMNFVEGSNLPNEDPLWDVREVGRLVFGEDVGLQGTRTFRALESVSELIIHWSSDPQDMSFPSLKHVDVFVVGGGEIAQLLEQGFPALESVSSRVDVSGAWGDNATCAAEAFIARLRADGIITEYVDVSTPSPGCPTP